MLTFIISFSYKVEDSYRNMLGKAAAALEEY
jgi:hypothetical protein